MLRMVTALWDRAFKYLVLTCRNLNLVCCGDFLSVLLKPDMKGDNENVFVRAAFHLT